MLLTNQKEEYIEVLSSHKDQKGHQQSQSFGGTKTIRQSIQDKTPKDPKLEASNLENQISNLKEQYKKDLQQEQVVLQEPPNEVPPKAEEASNN